MTNVTLTLAFNTFAEAAAALDKLQGNPAPVARETPSGTVKPKTIKTEVTAAQTDKPVVVVEPKATATTIDYADVKMAVGKLALIGAGEGDAGRAACRRILDTLGDDLKTFKDLPAGKWAEALTLLSAETAKLQGA